MKLLVTIPLSATDASHALALAHALRSTGPHTNPCLIVASTSADARPLTTALAGVFPSIEVIKPPFALADESYPIGYNWLFETAAKHIATHSTVAWLYLDPRCVPIRRGWLTDLEIAYQRAATPFMGAVLTPQQHSTPYPLLAAAAIYPPQLPKRMMQRLVSQRGTDFERSCADLVIPLATATPLIWSQPANGNAPICTPADVPKAAVLAHTGAARSLSRTLYGPPADAAKPPAITNDPVAIVEPGKRVASPVAPSPTKSYYHSGDLGDIVYALYAIRKAGGGRLLLGPQQRRTPSAADPIKEPKFELLRPLLEAQPYLSKVSYAPRHPGSDAAFDLNIFRSQWGDVDLRARTRISTLVRMHCHVLNVDERFRHDEAWLHIPAPIRHGFYCCHRSARYRNDDFPWPLIVKRYANRLLFVGLPAEHADFQRTFNCRVAYWQPTTLLELARVVAGAEGFVGNQSFPMAVALGCGQRVLQESWATSPDCIFARPNFLTQPFAEGQLAAWEKSPRLTLQPTPIVTTPTPAPAVPPVVELITPAPRRHVSTTPVNGLIELGPQDNAFGLGDTLAITPLAARLGSRAVMCLPERMRPYAELFADLCPVRITDDYPVFPNPGGERFIESKLRFFGFDCVDGATLPVVKLTENELATHRSNASTLTRPLIFHTTCAKQWAHMRSRPPEFFAPIADALAKLGFHVIADLNPANPLRHTAGIYSAIGLYCGVNTGNWHLAQAVGCRCLVIDADACDGYNPALWRYNTPAVEYVGFDQANILAKLQWLLPPVAAPAAAPAVPAPKPPTRRRR